MIAVQSLPLQDCQDDVTIEYQFCQEVEDEKERTDTPQVFTEKIMCGLNALPTVTVEYKSELLSKHKLSIALDLDETVLNATSDPFIIEMFLHKYGPNATHNSRDLHLIVVDDGMVLVKLRPFVHTFLSGISDLFEVNIFTMGIRPYASAVASILDPNQTLFKRIMSRENFSNIGTKTLSTVFPNSQDTVVIIDDRQDVWSDHLSNLVQVSPYKYFEEHDESFVLTDFEHIHETDDQLLDLQEVLCNLHNQFFKTDSADIRSIIRSRVLSGVNLLFSSRQKFSPCSHLWQLAQRLGASCHDELDENITHIVATERCSDLVIQAQEKYNVKIVSTDYLERCYATCTRLDETFFKPPYKEPKAMYFLTDDECEMITDNSQQTIEEMEEYVPEHPSLSHKRPRCTDDNFEEIEQPSKQMRFEEVNFE
ncbi:CPL4 [Acrasis kona]|uniref:RNA polymerase II subunit A C-terminal domain phosphatase n=1 Tax=Acrasis kona TaxID=1008807 RepID=A0AAW2Z9X9_9EUKA